MSRIDALQRHESNESACQTETRIIPISKEYGRQKNIPEELLEAGFINLEHLNFRQDKFGVYDIETVEEITDGMSREKAILSTLSIAFAGSQDEKAIFMHREGDTPNDAKDLVRSFLLEVELKAKEFQEENVPKKFVESLDKISDIESTRRKIWQQRREEGIPDAENKLELFPVEWKNWLRSMCTYRIYGYNSARFDARVLAPHLFDLLLTELKNDESNERTKNKINVLKRQQSYFNLSFAFPSSGIRIQFCDVMSYLSPMKLSKFLEMTNQPECKSIFPYQYYHGIEELRNAKEFPPHSAFYSDLESKLTCTEEQYNEAKNLFNRRMTLSDDDENKWSSMLDYLQYYNELDVIPLIGAIKSWFSTFQSTFSIDPFLFSSLAAMSQAAMFRLYDEDAPHLHSLPPWKKDFSKKFKSGLIGGLCTVLHRCVLLDGSDGPDAAKFAPNGDPYTAVIPYDFNSLYPWALLQDMPTGPGVHWDSSLTNGNRHYFIKKNLLPSSSLEEFQYLMYMNHNDPRFINSEGKPYLMHHAYYRGQQVIVGIKVDGYVETPQKKYVLEFHGCRWHQPCPFSGCQFNEGYFEEDRMDYDWYRKEVALRQWCSENNAELIVQWSCQFNFKALRDAETPEFPRIMRTFEQRNAKHISKLVLDDTLFGFVECSLRSPPHLIEKYAHLNFPPLIVRQKVTSDMLGDFMNERMKKLGRKLPANGEEKVINAWNADRIMLFTPLLKFYLEMGIQMTEVFDIQQYSRKSCFKRFINSCVEGRTNADAANKPTAAQTFKIAMNSS